MATEVPVILKVFAEQSSSVNAVLTNTKKRYAELSGSIESVAQKTALLAGAATLAMGGLILSVVKTAAEFEQLQVKLESTLGSGEAAAKQFGMALEYAAKTPFDVQSIVRATITLTAFGQSAQRTLPLAANLAAAFGERVDDVALVLGKAFSGSSRGFLSLTNQFGISNLQLQKFGAELTETGSISLRTTGALEKARDAVERIIKTRFGDAVEKQSKTLYGAMSNFGDIVQQVAASFGKELIPALTTGTIFVTGILKSFENLSPGMKQAIVLGAVAAVSFGAIATGAAALISVLASGLGHLVAFGAAIMAFVEAEAAAAGAAGAAAFAEGVAGVGAASTGAAVGVGRLAAAIPGAAAGMAGMAATVLGALGPFGVLALLVGGGLALALSHYKDQTLAANESIKAQAKALADAKNDLKLYSDLIEKAANAQGKLAGGGGSISQYGKNVTDALKGVAPNEFLVRLQAAGGSLDGLRKQLEQTKNTVKETGPAVSALSDVLGILKDRKATNIVAGLSMNEQAERIEVVTKLLKGQTPTIDNVTAALATYGEAFKDAVKTGRGIQETIDLLGKTTSKFDECTRSAQSLQQFISFATKPDDVTALSAAFDVVNGKIGEIEAALVKQGVPVGNIAALQQRLLSGTDDEKTAVAELLKLYEARDNITTKTVSVEKKGRDEQVKATESAFEREKLAGKENFDSEVERINVLLQMKGLSSEEELSLLKKKDSILKEQAGQQLKLGKESLASTVGEAKSSLEDLRATGNATGQETADAIQAVIAKLAAWAGANKVLLAQSPELEESLKSTVRGFEKELNSAKLSIPKERLTEALAAAKEFSSEALTNTEKLVAAQKSLSFLQSVSDSGQISTKAEKKKLQDAINAATKEEYALQQAVTKEEKSQARDTAALKRSSLEGELELLKAQQDLEGQTAYKKTQIAELERRILAEKMQAIRDQEAAEVEGGATAEQAHERAEIRITDIKNQETLKRIKAEQDLTKTTDDEAKKQQAIIEGFRKNRQGGQSSPLMGLDELSASSSFLPGFSLDPFSADTKPKSLGRPQNSALGRIRATIDQDVAAGNRAAGNGKLPGGSSVEPGYEAKSTTNIYNLALTGGKLHPEDEPTVRKIVDKYISDKRHAGEAS